MWTKTLTLAVLGAAVAGCTTSRTHLLPSYVLDNGQRLQDVVTVAGDNTGDAPSITVVKTYDVSRAGETVLVSHDTASAPSIGTVIAGGIAGAIPHAAAAVGIAAINKNRRPTVSANINVASANENNSAASSDNNNEVDVNNVASADNNNAVDVANAAISDATSVSISENNNIVSPDITNVAASSSDNNSVIAPEMTNVAASQSTSDNNSVNNNDATAVNINDNTNENLNVNANVNEINNDFTNINAIVLEGP